MKFVLIVLVFMNLLEVLFSKTYYLKIKKIEKTGMKHVPLIEKTTGWFKKFLKKVFGKNKSKNVYKELEKLTDDQVNALEDIDNDLKNAEDKDLTDENKDTNEEVDEDTPEDDGKKTGKGVKDVHKDKGDNDGQSQNNKMIYENEIRELELETKMYVMYHELLTLSTTHFPMACRLKKNVDCGQTAGMAGLVPTHTNHLLLPLQRIKSVTRNGKKDEIKIMYESQSDSEWYYFYIKVTRQQRLKLLRTTFILRIKALYQMIKDAIILKRKGFLYIEENLKYAPKEMKYTKGLLEENNKNAAKMRVKLKEEGILDEEVTEAAPDTDQKSKKSSEKKLKPKKSKEGNELQQEKKTRKRHHKKKTEEIFGNEDSQRESNEKKNGNKDPENEETKDVLVETITDDDLNNNRKENKMVDEVPGGVMEIKTTKKSKSKTRRKKKDKNDPNQDEEKSNEKQDIIKLTEAELEEKKEVEAFKKIEREQQEQQEEEQREKLQNLIEARYINLWGDITTKNQAETKSAGEILTTLMKEGGNLRAQIARLILLSMEASHLKQFQDRTDALLQHVYFQYNEIWSDYISFIEDHKKFMKTKKKSYENIQRVEYYLKDVDKNIKKKLGMEDKKDSETPEDESKPKKSNKSSKSGKNKQPKSDKKQSKTNHKGRYI
jgi:hypothetical protein